EMAGFCGTRLCSDAPGRRPNRHTGNDGACRWVPERLAGSRVALIVIAGCAGQYVGSELDRTRYDGRALADITLQGRHSCWPPLITGTGNRDGMQRSETLRG